MMKSLAVAVGIAIALSAGADAYGAQKRSTSKQRGAEVALKSDARVIGKCRDLRGAAFAACLHEQRGDEYAGTWRQIAEALGQSVPAMGGTSGAGSSQKVAGAKAKKSKRAQRQASQTRKTATR